MNQIFTSLRNLCYNITHDGSKNMQKNIMSLLHTDPAALGYLLRCILSLRHHWDCLRRARTLCKPLFCHHFLSQTSSLAGISVRPGFRHNRDTVCCQKPQRKNDIAHGETDCVTSVSHSSNHKSTRPFRALNHARDPLAQSLWHHHHKLYSQTGWAEILILFHTFYHWYNAQTM